MRGQVTTNSPNALHDELLAAGVRVQLLESDNTTAWVTFPPADQAKFNTVVAAHDPQQQAKTRRARALYELRARRDRYLAQTDVLALPDAALPTDLPTTLHDAIIANRAAWQTFRQQLRDYPSTVTDPFNPPALPQQPDTPSLILA